ncbi:MAG TPA: hypothetical protein DCL38_02505 [Lachnospiraceae bacterium]|nr:hypothetical protein [Lachnospiraceae bacterium]
MTKIMDDVCKNFYAGDDRELQEKVKEQAELKLHDPNYAVSERYKALAQDIARITAELTGKMNTRVKWMSDNNKIFYVRKSTADKYEQLNRKNNRDHKKFIAALTEEFANVFQKLTADDDKIAEHKNPKKGDPKYTRRATIDDFRLRIAQYRLKLRTDDNGNDPAGGVLHLV